MTTATISRYTLKEEILNSITHGLGVILAICGTVLMIIQSSNHNSTLALVNSLIYGISLILLYTMSTMYHAITNTRAKEILRIFDHTSIFLLIAGSYTPFCLIALQSNYKGILIAACVWICATIGVILNAIDLKKTEKIGIVLYVIMGWSIIAAIKDIVAALPTPAFWLLLTGGLAYTVGIIFYAMKRVNYMHGVWHIFVLSGSILHFLCISIYVLPMAY